MTDHPTQEQRALFEMEMWPLLATVLRFGRYLTHNDTEAEDLAQETMMRAFRSMTGFKPGTDAKAWLLTIERRLHIDRQRVRKNQRLMSLDHDDAPDVAAAEPAGVFDDQWEEPEELLQRFGDQELIDALKELPDEIRWTLLLVDVEGMDHTAAAEVLGVPEGTVKSRSHRGRRMLRDRLYERAAGRGWVTAAGKG